MKTEYSGMQPQYSVFLLIAASAPTIVRLYYFLIRAGKYFSYCSRPLEDELGKTCRDVGARKRYDDKCKTDPVWQTCNRAYKAHYARYMKKKMTVSEFEEWSRMASELRDKAIADEIPFEQYCVEIKK